jgi:cytochrome c peroxidase
MGSTHADLAQTIRERYSTELAVLYGLDPISDDDVFAHAETVLDAYMRKLVSLDAPFDRWLAGDESAVDDDVKRGFAVFVGRGLCADCHSTGRFTDLQFHTTGVPQTGLHVVADAGKAGAFLTPGLRNVAQTGPYMHDGVFATLPDVIAFYRRGGDASDVAKDPRIVPLDITDADADDLLAFLNALTGAPIADQWRQCRGSVCP